MLNRVSLLNLPVNILLAWWPDVSALLGGGRRLEPIEDTRVVLNISHAYRRLIILTQDAVVY